MEEEKGTSKQVSGSGGSSCEVPGGAILPAGDTRGAIFKYSGGGHWSGIPTVPYKDGGSHWEKIVRRSLVGAERGDTGFHLRYFEIERGGYSSLERHRHVHVVIGVRGLGEVRIGDTTHSLGPFDVTVIGPGETHRLANRNEEPFGFFCIVDAVRDVPVLVEGEKE